MLPRERCTSSSCCARARLRCARVRPDAPRFPLSVCPLIVHSVGNTRAYHSREHPALPWRCPLPPWLRFLHPRVAWGEADAKRRVTLLASMPPELFSSANHFLSVTTLRASERSKRQFLAHLTLSFPCDSPAVSCVCVCGVLPPPQRSPPCERFLIHALPPGFLPSLPHLPAPATRHDGHVPKSHAFSSSARSIRGYTRPYSLLGESNTSAPCPRNTHNHSPSPSYNNEGFWRCRAARGA